MDVNDWYVIFGSMICVYAYDLVDGWYVILGSMIVVYAYDCIER